MTPEALLRAFEPLAEAPGGVARLRELVLSLAVRGKLVPQDPGDEPASVLLTRIQAEKARLIKEGKLKKQEPLPPVSPDEMPFELPGGWVWVRLGELSAIRGGKRLPNGETYSEAATPYIYIQVTNMKGGTIIDNGLRCISEELHQALKRYLIFDDELYITIAGTIGQVGKVPKQFSGMNLTENAAAIRHWLCDGDYLRHSLTSASAQKHFQEQTNELAQPKLALKRIEMTPLPLPPLAEQHRIVARVDELMGLLDRLEAAQAQREAARVAHRASALAALRDANSPEDVALAWQRVSEGFRTLLCTPEDVAPLRQTILQLAVRGKLVPQDAGDEPASVLLTRIQAEKARLVKEGKLKKQEPLPPVSPDEMPFELPGGWVWVRLGELVDLRYPISYGVLVPGPHVDDGIPLIRISDLDVNPTESMPAKRIDRNVDKEYERTRIHGGEILLGVVGSIGKLGRVPTHWAGANIARALCRIKPWNTLNTDHLMLSLSAQSTQSYFLNATRTLAQPTLNIALIRETPLPLPPLAEQQRIVAKVDELMGLLDRLEAQLTQMREWQDAFAASAVQGLDG